MDADKRTFACFRLLAPVAGLSDRARATRLHLCTLLLGALFLEACTYSVADVEPKVECRTSDLKCGMVGWWSFDDTLDDTSGNDNQANLLGGPAKYEAGHSNDAIDLDGVPDLILINPSKSLNAITTSMTISLWLFVKQLSSEQQYRTIANRQKGSEIFDDFDLSLNDGAPQFVVDTSPLTTATAIESAPTPFYGVWTHFAATYDGQAMRLYHDGSKVAEVERRDAPLSGPDPRSVTLGGAYNDASGNPTEFLFGGLDEVRLYDRALDESDIKTLAAP